MILVLLPAYNEEESLPNLMPKIRESLNRKYSDEKLFKGIGWMHKYGIKVSSFNIIGCPGETREQVFETIELNRKLSVASCNVYIMFPYPGTPIQIESKLPIRDKNGRLHKVSEAKNLRLSKIPPDELEGLEKTFNIYLNLPKTLWPIIKLSESKINWTTILAPLKEFSIEYISDKVQNYDLKDDFMEIDSRTIPKKLCEIYFASTENNKPIILDSINKFLKNIHINNNLAKEFSFSQNIQ